MAEKFATTGEYLASFPEEVREKLEKVRAAILASVPGAEEKIRYGMPAVMFGGRYAVHFAGWKKHIGLYPIPALPAELEARVAPFRTGADSVNFALHKPIPYELITEVTAAIVALRSE
jgi:uncharacterized protein YdhG (YjbR/CyaY superfamily)